MRYVFASLFILASIATLAWEWPVPLREIQGTFGQQVPGGVLRGMEIGGGAQPVFPVERGVVVFVHRATGSFPSPLGSYVVVEHEQAFRSIYAHLSPESLPPVGREVTPETQIAVAGESGYIDGRALRLYLYDSRNRVFVNPLLLLPDLEDRAPPQIVSVFAQGERGLFSLTGSDILPAGRYVISARIIDTLARGRRSAVLAPYEIAVFVDGQERFRASADGISYATGELAIAPAGNGRELYGAEGLWVLGEVTVEGRRTEVEIVARDFAGNETVVSFDIAAGVPDWTP
ncbi:MAG: peptidoglycan DD-metalloendopeptidase family protein [Spirochaetales bacterium]